MSIPAINPAGFNPVSHTAAPSRAPEEREAGDCVRLGEGGDAPEIYGKTLSELGRGQEVFEHLDRAMAALRLAPLSQLDESRLQDYAESLPKVDLHRHLEGAITPEALIGVAQRHGVELPTQDAEALRPMMQITEEDKLAGEADGLKVFLSKFDLIGKIFKSPEVIEDIAYQVVADCHDDNLKYAELRFSPMYMAESYGLPLEQVTEAVLGGVQRATEDLGIKTGLIMIIERWKGVEAGWVVEKLAEKYKDQGVVALDLANNEYDFPPGPYKEVFQAAKQAGLKVTVHAGEVPVHAEDPTVGGPHNVRVSVEELGADRIGHGVRSIEDPQVEQMMIDRQIPYELCPLSNIQTQAVPDLDSHPIKRLLDAGAMVTVNNDDPAVSGITLSDDYVNITRGFGFSSADLRRFVDNGVEAAFTSEEIKADLREAVEDGFQQADRRLASSLTLGELRSLALQGAEQAGPVEVAAVAKEFDQLADWLCTTHPTVTLQKDTPQQGRTATS